MIKFGIEVNFLTFRYVATSFNDRRQGEWPPHPSRLFSALVAAWAEVDEPDADERKVLEWLESLRPPSICASSATFRTVGSHFVPVNDTAIIGSSFQERRASTIEDLNNQMHEELVLSYGEVTRRVSTLRRRLERELNVDRQVTNVGTTNPVTALEIMPEGRNKQERFFPSVTPDNPRVTYVWNDEISHGVGAILDGLLRRVTRLGHPSSLVSCRLTEGDVEPNMCPGEGTANIRAVRGGQLAELERQYERHNGNSPRSLPYTMVQYSDDDGVIHHMEEVVRPANAGEWVIFEFSHDSRSFLSWRAVELASVFRSSIMRYAEDPIPARISGHEPNGQPVDGPHAAFLPLPYVGYEHSDGRILGIALCLPEALSEDDRRAAFRAVGRWERSVHDCTYPLRLTLGSVGVAHMARIRADTTPTLSSLRYSTWRGPSRDWVSATPIALPRHPGRLTSGTTTAQARAWSAAEEAVLAACRYEGLPAPAFIEVSLDPFIKGARLAHRFPAFKQRGRDGTLIRRQLVHASITFDKPVTGPLALGAGMFLGLGLMRPAASIESEGRRSGE